MRQLSRSDLRFIRSQTRLNTQDPDKVNEGDQRVAMIGEDRIERFIKNIKKELSETVHQAPYTQHLPLSTQHQAPSTKTKLRHAWYVLRMSAACGLQISNEGVAQVVDDLGNPLAFTTREVLGHSSQLASICLSTAGFVALRNTVITPHPDGHTSAPLGHEHGTLECTRIAKGDCARGRLSAKGSR